MKPILVAEDYEPDAELLNRSLKLAGIVNPAFWVSDGKEAIAYLNGDGQFADREKFPLPGVLMLDLKMPHVDGFEVLEWWKNQPQLKEIVVVVLSGRRELQEIARAYQLGARTFVAKPLTNQEMLSLARSFTAFCVGPPELPH